MKRVKEFMGGLVSEAYSEAVQAYISIKERQVVAEKCDCTLNTVSNVLARRSSVTDKTLPAVVMCAKIAKENWEKDRAKARRIKKYFERLM